MVERAFLRNIPSLSEIRFLLGLFPFIFTVRQNLKEIKFKKIGYSTNSDSKKQFTGSGIILNFVLVEMSNDVSWTNLYRVR